MAELNASNDTRLLRMNMTPDIGIEIPTLLAEIIRRELACAEYERVWLTFSPLQRAWLTLCRRAPQQGYVPGFPRRKRSRVRRVS